MSFQSSWPTLKSATARQTKIVRLDTKILGHLIDAQNNRVWLITHIWRYQEPNSIPFTVILRYLDPQGNADLEPTSRQRKRPKTSKKSSKGQWFRCFWGRGRRSKDSILCYTKLYYTIVTILYYTILYYTILYYTILYYTILYYTIQYNTILYAMLCYAMLCYAMLCYAMLCYAILYAMLCYAMLCNAMLCYAMLCYAMLCYAMLCYAMLCYAMLCCAFPASRAVEPSPPPPESVSIHASHLTL